MSQLAPYETSEQAVEWALDEHGEELKDCYNYLSSLAFPLTIYRAIRVSEFSDTERTSNGELLLNGKNNSRSWTTNISIYKNERSKFRRCRDIVACEINPGIIDNAQTISNYVYYTAKPEYSLFGEYEITLKKNFRQTDLQNLRVIDKNSINEEMKVHRLVEWTDSQQKDILNAMDAAENEESGKDQKNQSNQSSDKILSSIQSTTYKDEQSLINDVTRLIDAWQQGK